MAEVVARTLDEAHEQGAQAAKPKPRRLSRSKLREALVMLYDETVRIQHVDRGLACFFRQSVPDDQGFMRLKEQKIAEVTTDSTDPDVLDNMNYALLVGAARALGLEPYWDGTMLRMKRYEPAEPAKEEK
jgi:hypothetical protein